MFWNWDLIEVYIGHFKRKCFVFSTIFLSQRWQIILAHNVLGIVQLHVSLGNLKEFVLILTLLCSYFNNNGFKHRNTFDFLD
jgi:hypothetical protein